MAMKSYEHVFDGMNTDEQGQALARGLCVFLFEGNMYKMIVRRWLLYAPRPHESLDDNLTVLLRGVCTADVRVEITQRHLQFFDCDALHIMHDTICKIPPIVMLMKMMYTHFRKLDSDQGSREFAVRGFNYDHLLQQSVCRYTILHGLVNTILTDASTTKQYVSVRESVEKILTDLYAEVEQHKCGWFIARVIHDMRLSMRNGDCIKFLQSSPSCALLDSKHCILHHRHCNPES